MIFHPRDALIGLGLYLAVCLVALGAGNGLLKVLRVQLEERLRFFFAPIVTLLLWVVVLGLAGAVGWPLRYVCPCLWGATLVLFGYGCWAGPRIPLASLPWLLLCAALPVLALVHMFAFGLLEYGPTLTNDGWNYIAAAQYFWEFGRTTVEGQPAFYDSGIHLAQTRYISPSLIALFSYLREGGETIYMGSLLQAFALYCAGSAVFFFWLTQRRPHLFAAAATAIMLLCGWVLRAVWLSNYDNTVFLFFMPALAGFLAVMPPGDRSYRFLTGVFLAAGAYLYVECFLIGVAGVLIFTAPRLWQERAVWRNWLGAGTVATAVGLVLLLPASGLLTEFFMRQVHHVNQVPGARGGEGIAPDFLGTRHFLEAAWSLSGYCTSSAPEVYKRLCAAVLTALLGLGLCQLVRERRWGLVLCLGFFGAGVASMVLRAHYDYGAYKFLNLSWWCLAGVLVGGVDWLIRLGRTEYVRSAALSATAFSVAAFAYMTEVSQPGVAWLYAGAGLVIGIEWLACLRTYRVYPILVSSLFLPLGVGYAYLSRVSVQGDRSKVETQRLSDFRQTKALRRIVGAAPVLDASDDWLNCLVSRYNLRQFNSYPVLCRGITRFGAIPGMRDARSCDPATRYLITDSFAVLNRVLEQTATRLAVLSSYTLWDLNHGTHGATLVNVDTPYSVELHKEVVHFWMGPGQTVAWVHAAQDGEVSFDWSFGVGPCGPDTPVRTLQVTTPTGYEERHAISNGRRLLRVPVRAGLTQVRLEVLEPPVRAQASAGDTRTLLLLVAMHGTRFVPAGESPGLTREHKQSVRSTP